MVAKEVRELRTLSKKLVEIEEKGKMLVRLQKKKICLPAEELFVKKMQSKFKILGDKRGVSGNQRDEFMSITMRYKVKDNTLHGIKVRKRRNYVRWRLETQMSSGEWKKLWDDVKKNTDRLRKKLKQKYVKKVDHLTKKYGMMRKNQDYDEKLMKYMGDPGVFKYDVGPDDVKDPIIVENVGENIVLSMDEIEVLKLGPKLCVC